MSQYGKADYWEERYTRDPEPFDWYQRFQGIKQFIVPYLTAESRILNVGAGNSRLSEELFDEGYTYITNIDISQVVTKQMQEKYKDKPSTFKYIMMDVKIMDLPNSSFDIVIDKGTLDSVICGENTVTNAMKALTNISQILKPNGIYICISYGQPDHRLLYLDKQKYGWIISVEQVHKPTISTSIQLTSEDKDSPNVHYIYICKKGQNRTDQDNN
ncbi:protein kinase domain protein [Ichthyophthirius multifiliis]|uniref:Protein kinase domain protein n=1 Tax=Ichthyophthirius multifiliis TaxID=5932 RepID=G0QIT7_ICHMU|nr:protein kinase domain protein [Ichthyophthirius multifiliis]EGR34823.1 protein kinase domain protein [Ichthyophthirius multifiliis]|eukprot:XP_004040127.1 protein kinase domain protein [Ichthyophthirius multifiliis]